MKKDSKQHYLGKLSLNYADEIDFVFFDVFDEEGKKKLVSTLKKLGDNTIDIVFGTNEESEFSGNDILDNIEWKKIPNDKVRKFLENNVCDYSNSLLEALNSLDSYDISEDDDLDEES